MAYSVDSLRAAVERAKTNIRSLNVAIKEQRNLIADYQKMILELEKEKANAGD